ncbi:MAG TPA: DUF3093 family protein [Bryobacteraceae bacterium]|nr:DUF3093 family protein [Bryobacteraceae bacterium]
MPVPISRYRVPRQYLWAGLVALALTGFSAWVSLTSPLCWIATGLLLLSAGMVLFLASRPPVEIYDSHVKIGKTAIPWKQIRRLDRSAYAPLTVRLTLSDKSKILVIYAGDQESSSGLLRNLRRYSREALIDGVPYRQFWGEAITAAAAKRQLPAARYPLMLPEDEAEVERLFHRLKSVGHLDQKTEDK